ncbi:hypothetical protein AB0B25_09375 [Nocardia sp. NPDC049190]|uniref:hypothetical protein n=1 Tax=Nocardia sp. NPDC049190 TaxID=3155650 RepID=UPI003400C98D
MTRDFHEAMRLMRRHDPQSREDGFHLLVPKAADHLDELIEQFEHEHDDHGLQCWLLELIGEARSPAALPILDAQLNRSDESLRDWAVGRIDQTRHP